MASKNQPEAGIRSPFRMRLGIDFDSFRGMNKEADPGAIRDDEFQDAKNCRILANGMVVPRGGQEAVNEVAMDGDVDAIIDDERKDDEVTSRLFYDKNGTTPNTFQLVALKQGEDTGESVVDNVGLADNNVRLIDFEETLIGISKSTLYEIDPVLGTSTLLDTTGATADDTDITGVVKHDFKLWLAAREDNVYTWDGSSIVTVGTSLGTMAGDGYDQGGKIFRYLGDAIYTNAHAMARYAGGAWTSISLPGGLMSFRCFDAKELDGVLYLLGADVKGANDVDIVIVSYDGTSTAVARTLGNETSPTSRTGVSCGVVVDNVLYFAWSDPADHHVILGRYDGTTWTNNYQDVTGDDLSSGDPWSMAYFDRRLWIGGTSGFPLARSEQDDFTQPWTEVENEDDSLAYAMLVFKG